MYLDDTTHSDITAGTISCATPAELAAASWIAGYSNEKTRKAYSLHLKDWFTFCIKHEIDPMHVKRVHIDLWIRSLEQRGLKPRTRSLKVTTVRGFYNYCVDENWLDSSPATRVKGPKIERYSPRSPISRTQLADLIDGARELGDHAYAVVLLLSFNGTRIGETCAANIEDFTYVGFNPVLHLPNRKGGKAGYADLARPTEQAFLACIGERTNGPLFLNRADNRMTRSNVQTILNRASENCRGRMPKLSPHVLRHTWATLAIESGVSLSRLQHDGGWADTRMAEFYTHIKGDPLSAVTHSVAAHVMSTTS